MARVFLILSLLLASGAAAAAAQGLRTADFMQKAQRGFEQIFNLDYQEAAHTFSRLREEYPQHPGPPLYQAVVIWLYELFEREELELDHFLAEGYFTRPSSRALAPERRQTFIDAVESSRKLCEAILKEDAGNRDARYFLGASHGVLGGFAVTIDRSFRQAFAHGKKAYAYHNSLVEDDPHYYDAYISVGVYEYVVDSVPWYLKWLAVIIGYRGSKERGFEYLELAAQKARFTVDDARTMQMVLFVREGRYAEALQKARTLHQKYPKNFLFHLNQAQILERMGKAAEATSVYREVLHKAQSGAPNYDKIPPETFPRLEKKLAELSSKELNISAADRLSSGHIEDRHGRGAAGASLHPAEARMVVEGPLQGPEPDRGGSARQASQRTGRWGDAL